MSGLDLVSQTLPRPWPLHLARLRVIQSLGLVVGSRRKPAAHGQANAELSDKNNRFGKTPR
jgi:hypothetical protein